jgi:hypothetical protein
MKTLLALLCSLVVVGSTSAQTPAPPPPGYPGKTETKKAEPEPAKKEPAKIEGIVVARGEKGFLGVQMVNGTFRIAFYDVKKKPVEVDVTRAVLRWDPKYKVGQDRVVLNRSDDGKALVSPRNIRPPYNFKLFITLLKEATDAEEPVGETHVIDFRA